MILMLEVMGDQAAALGAAGRKAFHAIGGTIGRLPDNDWVFPDPYVSGRHALIRYLNGRFFIEDTSTNGVFINSPNHRLSKTQAHPLSSGDVLYIDSYQIKVAIESGDAGQSAADPLEALRGRGSPRPRPASPPPLTEEDHTETIVLEEEPTEWFGMSEAAAQAPATPSARAHAPSPSPAISSPSASATPVAGSGTSSSKYPQAATDATQLRELLAAAGMEGVEASPELARTLGEMLRVLVAGVMEVLRGRERMKDELRMRGTTFQPAHNNPLKFSANVDDAFHNMLVKQNPAYLSPPDALEDALHDIRDHQAAFLAATRLAFESMLSQFDPERMQEEFDKQARKGSIIGVPAKLRYWELYREKYDVLAKDGDASFRKLFGEEFAKAYEDRLSRSNAKKR